MAVPSQDCVSVQNREVCAPYPNDHFPLLVITLWDNYPSIPIHKSSSSLSTGTHSMVPRVHCYSNRGESLWAGYIIILPLCLDHDYLRQKNILYFCLSRSLQAHNANQLTDWCLHFISTNFSVFVEVEEFCLLQEEHRTHVEEHRWPPLSYMEALKKYKKSAAPFNPVSKCKVM